MTHQPPRDQNKPVRARIPSWNCWKQITRSPEEDAEEPASTRSCEQFSAYLLSSLQMQNLLILSGLGTSRHVDGPDMRDLWEACVSGGSEAAAPTLESVRYGKVEGERNIEELLSRCDAVLQVDPNVPRIAEFRSHAIETILKLCRQPGSDSDRLDLHREFLRRLSRRRARDPRLKLFTTNYDRCFEVAAGSLGLVVVDGFSFSEPRRFDPRFFDYDIVTRNYGSEDSLTLIPGLFRYYKLHGSVDWRLIRGAIVVDPQVEAQDAALIYPASSKFRASYQQPHLELTAQYLSALRQPNTCLVVVGFGFNDEHLSEPIIAALESNPHLRVVIVSPGGEAKTERDSGNYAWSRLTTLAARGADVAFVGATFQAFVPLIPDLRAMSPADQLVDAVKRVSQQ